MVDAHYHHQLDDIIKGGKFQYQNGCITVPNEPGLGVELDRDKLKKYDRLYKETESHYYSSDPSRPEWVPLIPLMVEKFSLW